jgi:uncharacterized membrane protein
VILNFFHREISGRYPAIDIFRGLAIFTMIAANSAAMSLAAPHPFLFRIYGSFAAPIFIFLAGFMAALTAGQSSVKACVKRGIAVILAGVFVDIVIWRIVPFTTFDVLYLIGFGIPVVALTMRLQVAWRVLICLACLALGPILQHFLAYEAAPQEFALDGFTFAQLPHGAGWWFRSLVLDGWFPLFPWLGFMIAGTLICTHGDFIAREWNLFLTLGLIMAGSGVTWLFYHPGIGEREGYSELFYPPGFAYISAATGVILAGTALLQFLKPVFGLQFLAWLGSSSLFIYILHSAVIAFVLDEYFTGLPLGKFLLLYAAFTAGMIICAWILLQIKKTPGWKKIPKPLRFVFGG